MSSPTLALASLVAVAALAVTPTVVAHAAEPGVAEVSGLASRGAPTSRAADRRGDDASTSAGRIGCNTHPGPLNADLVRAHLDDLLAAERIPAVGIIDVAVRATELDGDPRTEEAFVDLVGPTMCLTGGCLTIVAQRGRDGGLATLGRGVSLYTIATRSSGWSDLSEGNLLPFPRRTMRFVRGRYQ